MAVGEIFLSAILKVLLTQLASGKLQSFVREVAIGPKLEKWENMLKMIQAVIEDAEAKQLTKSAVKAWLGELQDLAYEMEDILDEFATKALGRMLKARQGTTTSKTLSKIPDIKLNFHMWSKMNSVTSRLTKLSNRVTALGLREISGETSTAAYTTPPTTSLVPARADVYGRDEDKAKILEMVLGGAAGETSFCVISVIGMGGIGKTTLAREVYNDESVVKHFGVRVWVSIHDDFDVLRISKTILNSVLPSSSDTRDKDLNQVQVQLKQQLAGKIFLLVLDDVWSRSYDLWESVTSPFTAAAVGSKIIMTTRHKEVALVTGSHQHVHELEVLSDGDCWSVFVIHAFANRDIKAHQNLTQIREKVIKKCRGLPLAAKTLGGLLHSKQSDYEWDDVLDSNLWDLSYEDCNILPVLRLSYYHLPSQLKSCFAFCAILPKGYEFEEEEIVLLWMAEGFFQPEDNKQPEAQGHKYFRDLLSMSLFQPSSNNGSKFIIHDLVNDLAKWISGETTLRLENELRPSKQSRSFNKALHLCYTSSYCDGPDRFEGFHDAKRLRTLLATVLDDNPHYLSNAILPSLLPKLKKLRVLSLKNYQGFELSNSIAGLKHLRYLNFSDTTIRNLPESISTLYNLQILMLKYCRRLKMLPSDIGNLVNLRHLNIKGANLIREMPSRMNKLECLQTLSNFIVGKSNGSNLKDLNDLKFIAGELHISSLENTCNSDQANGDIVDQDITEAILIDKQYLEVLMLEWGYQFDVCRNEIAEKNVLDMLKPHENLKELIIKNYAGRYFPSWVGDPRSLSNLTVLRLERCNNCESLPSLGFLDSLEDLVIKEMSGLKHIGSEIYREGCSIPFRSLKNLHFEDLQEWERWDRINESHQIQILPSLCKLSIVNCPRLLAIPPNPLPSLENLVIHECTQLTVSVYNLPSLRKLEVMKCLGLVVSARSLPMLNELEISECRRMFFNSPIDFMSLKSLILSDISEFKNWFMQEFVTVECFQIDSCEELMNFGQPLSSLTSLRELYIWNFPSFISFPDAYFFSFLNKLSIKSCPTLRSLPDGIKHINACLEHLEISYCDSLKFIFKDQLPLSLKSFVVESCTNLRCLFGDRKDTSTSFALHNNTSLLEKLEVIYCHSLTCLSSKGQLPVTLKHLSIYACLVLKTLSSGPLPTALKYLSVWKCSKLTTLSCQLPHTLEHLSIHSCTNLVSIAQSFDTNSSLDTILIANCNNLKSLPDGLHKLSSLRSIKLHSCHYLVFFPEGGLPDTNLINCSIANCGKLKALPNRMHSLNSLQQLTIEKCRSIVSFPEEGFPTQLKKLNIEDSKIYKLLIQWGFHKLTSLRELEIWGCPNADSFPQEEMGMMLPTSLTHLTIANFPKLKKLCSKGFQSLSSLECLNILNCPNLKSFPEEGLPSSLLQLYLVDCPLLKERCIGANKERWSKMAHIPVISPLLKERYKMAQRKTRSKIAHIPLIKIDHKFIDDIEEE